jgi:hypothetical protein
VWSKTELERSRGHGYGQATTEARIAGDKTICLPIEDGLDYPALVDGSALFRQYVDQQIAAHPELFPKGY